MQLGKQEQFYHPIKTFTNKQIYKNTKIRSGKNSNNTYINIMVVSYEQQHGWLRHIKSITQEKFKRTVYKAKTRGRNRREGGRKK